MQLKTVSDVQLFCRENNIAMIDFKMTDIDGRWRHISIPVARFNDDTLRYGIGFDGSNYGFAPVENSDMVFIPDLSTAAIDPFCEVPTLSMSGDAMIIDSPANRPFDQYPRNVIRAAVDFMKSTGIADTMIIGPEFEFHVFDNAWYEVKSNGASYEVDTQQAEWNANSDDSKGYQVNPKRGYHISAPNDITQDTRSRMCMLMEEMGVPVKYHHHEVGGSGQLEIEVELGEVCSMADRTMITKYVIKNQAIREGKTATFMPKPIATEAGNGMHVHMLLYFTMPRATQASARRRTGSWAAFSRTQLPCAPSRTPPRTPSSDLCRASRLRSPSVTRQPTAAPSSAFRPTPNRLTPSASSSATPTRPAILILRTRLS